MNKLDIVAKCRAWNFPEELIQARQWEVDGVSLLTIAREAATFCECILAHRKAVVIQTQIDIAKVNQEREQALVGTTHWYELFYTTQVLHHWSRKAEDGQKVWRDRLAFFNEAQDYIEAYGLSGVDRVLVTPPPTQPIGLLTAEPDYGLGSSQADSPRQHQGEEAEPDTSALDAYADVFAKIERDHAASVQLRTAGNHGILPAPQDWWKQFLTKENEDGLQ